MGGSKTLPKEVKMKGQHCPPSEATTTRAPEKDSQYDMVKVKPGTKKKAKNDDGPKTTISLSASKIPVKEKDHNKVQVAKAPILVRDEIVMSKAPRQRKKPIVNKFAELTNHMHTKLENDDSAVVECTYLALDERAVVSVRSQGWEA
jgi:hypothetical protein